jgi:hypothetical protein
MKHFRKRGVITSCLEGIVFGILVRSIILLILGIEEPPESAYYNKKYPIIFPEPQKDHYRKFVEGTLTVLTKLNSHNFLETINGKEGFRVDSKGI